MAVTFYGRKFASFFRLKRYRGLISVISRIGVESGPLSGISGRECPEVCPEMCPLICPEV